MDNSTTESESDDSSSLESKQVQNGEDLERELRELFEYLDADRDSVLDKDEFERAFFELEIFLETSELDRLFKKYSSTVYPDGEVGVNYHHFRAVLRELTKRRETKSLSLRSSSCASICATAAVLAASCDSRRARVSLCSAARAT